MCGYFITFHLETFGKFSKMAKTRRRNHNHNHNHKVRRTKSRRGGGPTGSPYITIGKQTFGPKDPVPYLLSGNLPFNATKEQRRFPSGNPFTPSQNWGVKPPKTELQRLAKILAKKLDAEKDLIQRNKTLNPLQQSLAIKAKKIKMNDEINKAAEIEAQRQHEEALRTSRFPKLINSVASVRRSLGSVTSRISNSISDRLNKFMDTLEPEQTYSKERLNRMTDVEMSHLMEDMSPHMVESIDWVNLESITKVPTMGGSLMVKYFGNDTPMLLHSIAYSASQPQKGV